jgi:glutamine synthetase
VWGLENREAALRLVAGTPGSGAWAANLEVKCFDQTANPYLVVAALIFAGLAGVAGHATLPPPVDVDPALLGGDERVRRLPASLDESTDAFAADETLTGAFGPELTAAILAVRRGEIEHFADADADQITSALRWAHCPHRTVLSRRWPGRRTSRSPGRPARSGGTRHAA